MIYTFYYIFIILFLLIIIINKNIKNELRFKIKLL